MRFNYTILCLGLLMLCATEGYTQSTNLKFGETTIGQNQLFEVIIEVQNDQLKQYSNFPELEGFRKASTVSKTGTVIINNKITRTQSIVQTYVPQRKGTFRVQPFSMTVNGVELRTPGTTVTVTAAVQRNSSDPFADFWGFGRNNSTEFIDVKEDAFFAVNVSDKSVYVGEGFGLDVAFYESITSRAEMEFYQLGEQITDIIKEIKPANAWEENFRIESVRPELVTINGSSYRKYKLFEAVYFPLNASDIVIPAVDLKMIKYKIAKNPGFFGTRRQQDFKDFSSKPIKVNVKPLPPHPLADKVNVGVYQLDEEPVSYLQDNTGESFTYRYTIRGQGNIAAINEPTPSADDNFQFYPPAINQQITRANSAVFGTKTFEYYVEPQEPGVYNMSDQLEFTFFNPKTAKYESLRPQLKVGVQGESMHNARLAAKDLGSFYKAEATASNELKSLNEPEWPKDLLFILMTFVAIATLGMAIKKR
jgi:hypothetical protein